MKTDFSDVRVLIAENEVTSRLILCEMLSSVGVKHCYDAENGQDALDYFSQNPVDLVITDWYMHPMDGLELTSAIRHVGNGPRAMTPIMILTSLADLKGVVSARQLGISQFLAKPVGRDELANRMHIALHEPVRFVQRGSIYVAKKDCRPVPPPPAYPPQDAEQIWNV